LRTPEGIKNVRHTVGEETELTDDRYAILAKYVDVIREPAEKSSDKQEIGYETKVETDGDYADKKKTGKGR